MSHGVPRYFIWVADRWLRKFSFDCVDHRPHEFDLVWVVTYTCVFVFIWVFIRVRMVLKAVGLALKPIGNSIGNQQVLLIEDFGSEPLVAVITQRHPSPLLIGRPNPA